MTSRYRDHPDRLGGEHAVASEVPRFAQLTTMRVGGAARRLRIAHTGEELQRFARELWASDEPWLLLGGGSNTVVADGQYPGTVVLVRNTGIEQRRLPQEPDRGARSTAETPRVCVRVQAGHAWDDFVAFCVQQGWAGVEALSGIPGLVGAAPIQNIGAYGAELSDVLHSIQFLDGSSGEVVSLRAEQLELGYRDSVLKRGRAGVVLSIDVVLDGADAANSGASSAPIRYRQLADALGVTVGSRVPLRDLRAAVLRLRAAKGMLLNETDHDTWSAGSFFTNPIVSERFARTLPDGAPRFAVGDKPDETVVVTFEELARGITPRQAPAATPGRVKLSAAWLIEHAGITRGWRLPGARAAISSKHALAITNRGGATAEEIAQLARFVQQRVQQEFGVILEPEPRLYGIEL